ncbi:hypothetical protein B566_EDAN011269, partial [Ephemera danica]
MRVSPDLTWVGHVDGNGKDYASFRGNMADKKELIRIRCKSVRNMAIDPLENELHELRALSVMNSTDITSSAPTMSSEIEQALVGPLERQLAEMHEDTSADNTSQSSDATFTPEPMSEDSGSSD